MHHRIRRVVAEACEPRRLLAAAVALDARGLLTFTGTQVAEDVRLSRDGKYLAVAVDGAEIGRFGYAGVKSIVARLAGGDDVIEVDANVLRRATLLGDVGDDTLVGGGGTDSLDGGAGTDVASYANRAGGIRASLVATITPTPDVGGSAGSTAGTADAGGGDVDALRDVETIVGGAGDDRIALAASNPSDTPIGPPTSTCVPRAARARIASRSAATRRSCSSSPTAARGTTCWRRPVPLTSSSSMPRAAS